jgi:hypothetical protein
MGRKMRKRMITILIVKNTMKKKVQTIKIIDSEINVAVIYGTKFIRYLTENCEL